nr:recombinase family protein [Pseudoflavonifractor sp. 524-17]
MIKIGRWLFSVQKEFGYARVSTARQHEDRQVQALLDYGIEERNIVVDKESGKDFNRLGYLSLKEKWLRRGDTLVVKELDRLGRNKAKIREELEWFRAEGIRVKILNVPTTLLDCEGQDWVLDMVSDILIEVMASVAEEERVKIHQRQAEGIAIAQEKGVVFGRPVVAKPDNFEMVMALVDSGQLKAVEAMRELGVKKTTYYKMRRSFLQAADRV